MKRLLLLFLVIGCQNSSQNVDELPVALPRKQIFYFAGIALHQPATSKLTFSRGEPKTEIIWETNFYTTNIADGFEPITEDMKYKFLDEAQSLIIRVHTSPTATIERISPKVVARQLYTFNSYKEASIGLQKILNGDYHEVTNVNTGETTYELN